MASLNRIIPAKIDEKLADNIRKTSKEAFKALNLSGICRIDYLIDTKSKKFYINEPNTIPGSLSFYLWTPIGKTHEQLLDEAITIAIKQYKTKHSKTFSFETNILHNFSGLKGIKGLKK